MDPVSNADRLIQVLRQRLQDRSRTSTSSRKAPAGTRADGLVPLAPVAGGDERQFRRALVQNILVEHFGADLVNDARFQELVDRVTVSLERDENGAALLGRVAYDVRGER
ncbi:hypothetical protein [Sphingomonas sanxanigenens]|uniref:Uncharacterized protein n=1 Tax=Sphingomonas sanxanigenens DSM 19645 = NX02 TaxID=1123269 RepID=W0AGG9_9SPHN|nr:hypothetical protein [Sphingomonas sanxanigenens]AHE55637.1 hypothetical protein NX02_19890 [Sphingomonas sanxanigenens DSM 19645 = NX02]